MSIKNIKYRTLIARHGESVYYYAFSFLKNEMDAEDVSQEVWLKVWNNIDNFSWTKAKAWILKTTHNSAIDILRKRKKDFNEITENEVELIQDESFESNPGRIAEARSSLTNIEDAISRLPEQLRSVFLLYEIEGFKYREIAEILKIPVNSVKVYLMRARIKLQEMVQLLEEEIYE